MILIFILHDVSWFILLRYVAFCCEEVWSIANLKYYTNMLYKQNLYFLDE